MPDFVVLVRCRESDCAAGLSCSSRAPDAVDIIFGEFGNIIIDNQFYADDIYSACSDIGCDEYAIFACLKTFERIAALGQRSV